MAEGLARDTFGSLARIYSAGSHPSGIVHPMAVQVMREIGIDIRRHTSCHWNDLPVGEFDLIITLSEQANQVCSLTPRGNGTRKHMPFPDPVRLIESPETILQAFRELREQLLEELLPVVETFVNKRR